MIQFFCKIVYDVFLILLEKALNNIGKVKEKILANPGTSICILMFLLIASISLNCVLLSTHFESDNATLQGIVTETTKATENTNTLETATINTVDIDIPLETSTSVISFTKDDVVIGKTIEFGKYKQDSSELAAEEPIEWLVIKQEDDRALLISVMALEVFQYHTALKSEGWESCSLRNKLNNIFFEAAFTTEEEKSRILEVENVQHEHPDYPNWEQGPASKDKVFLLSCVEYAEYMSGVYELQEEAICGRPTKYVQKKYLGKQSTAQKNWWWLRTSANNMEDACRVSEIGYIMEPCGITALGLVRPAIWIKLE